MSFIITITDNIVFTIKLSARYSVEYVLEKDDSGNYSFEHIDLEMLGKLLEKDCYILSDILMDNFSNINIKENVD